MFNESGCTECRQAWHSANRSGVLEQVVRANYERQASLYRCKVCGGYWEDPNGNFPAGITAAEAAQFYGIA